MSGSGWWAVVTDDRGCFEIAEIAAGTQAYATRAEADAVAVALRCARDDEAARTVARRQAAS